MNPIKKNLLSAALLASLSATALAGCGSAASDPSAGTRAGGAGGCKDVPAVKFASSVEDAAPVGVPEPAKKDFTIAYANGLDAAEPLHIEGISAKLATQKLGGTFVTSDAAGQPDQQLSQVQRFIAQKVDGILVSVLDPGTLAPALKQAKAAGIPVIGVEIALDSSEPGNGWAAQILPGRDRAAFLQARTAARLMPCKAGFVSADFVVKIPIIKYVVAREKYWGEKFGLSQLGVGMAKSDDSAGGEGAMTQLLGQHPKLSGAIIYTDSVAEGAYGAARSAGRRDLPIIGGNGGNGGFEAVRAGRIAATVQLNYPEVGKLGVWGLYQVLQGKKIPRTFKTPEPKVVTPANVKSLPDWNAQLTALYGTAK